MVLLEERIKRITNGKEYPLEPNKPRNWLSILTLPPSSPQINTMIEWSNLLPSTMNGLAHILKEITQNDHPYKHQEQAITHLLSTSISEWQQDLIINGGTYSGKSLSFVVPGITKILTGELDFFVVFYPSKQLLLDQFDRMKELVVKLAEETGKRLTVKMYSGDIKNKESSMETFSPKKKELFETEQHPPNILLATFDKVWYQLISGKMNPLLEKILNCQYLVFDEIHAFEGFAAAIIKGFIKIHKLLNPNSRFILSSATIDNVQGFRDDFLPSAEIITCPPVHGEQMFLGVTKEHTIPLLVELWEGLKSLPGKICLVFLDSKEEIELLTQKLCTKLKQDDPYFDSDTIVMIHADLPYSQRKQVLDEIRKEEQNKIRILLSSSVLELGVNLQNVQIVINIGIPITQKDGIVQRMARNRSKPGERRVNAFLFNLANPRDKFYWEHVDILRTILEKNTCNPILYPKENTKILAGLLILHLRYGINDFQQIMTFFLKEGIRTHELARQQYTKLICFKVIKKENGKVMFTNEGQEILEQKLQKNNILIPFSIRSISKDWSIMITHGLENDQYHEMMKPIGKISSLDVLKKGLPGNILHRNKQQYLVLDIDHQQKNIYTKHFLEGKKSETFSIPYNCLFDPVISVEVFPKKAFGKKIMNITFGQQTITMKPKALANANPERIIMNDTESTQNFSWQELTQEESEDLAIVEQVEGICFNLITIPQKKTNLSIKQLLKLFGEVLLIEAETILSIPLSEFGLIFNENQMAIYDKGEPNGNSEYLFKHLHLVAGKALDRLQTCSCKQGCKLCYGEILGLLPEGAKEWLVQLIKGMEKDGEMKYEECLEEQMVIQDNYQEGRIIALSDIHLTSELCYEDEFYQAISSLSKQVDIIIINGDLLDKPSEAGKKAFEKLQKLAHKEGFWSKLVFIKSSSIHDANIEQTASALYLDYALLETPVGEVLIVHGNKIGIDPGEVKTTTAEQAVIEAKNKLIQIGRSWLPRVTKETHLVIGHLHERFYNERWRVYGLGHWTEKGNTYHQKCLLIINCKEKYDIIKLLSYN
ncbi:MAG: DEAD/DEAH box helicase [Candidatus Heimdallarchaeota archaeon]|nr:DEAD/DEAH box helicase [Candidatus Heimdallarchaeota archaeon]